MVQKYNSRELAKYVVFLFFFFVSISDISYFSNKAYSKDRIESITLGEVRRRRMVEDNGVADMLCKLVSLMHSDISRALLAFSLFAAGMGAFFGKLTMAWFFSFAIGAAVFFGSISMLSFFAPYSDVAMGCKCKRFLTIGQKPDSSGYIKVRSKLREDCSRLDNPSASGNTMV